MTTSPMTNTKNVSAGNNTTMATWAGAIARALGHKGVDAELLFYRTGIDYGLVNNPMQRIPVAQMTRLWDAAVVETGDRTFGLAVAEQVNLTTFHALSVAAMASEDVGRATEVVCQYASMVSDGIDMRQIQSSRETGLVLGFRPGYPRFADPCVEAVFATLVRICREILPDVSPSRVNFRHRTPLDPGVYRQFFGCPVAFGADEDALYTPRSRLPDGPLPTSSASVARANRDLCQDYMQRQGQGGLQTRVRERLREALGRGALVGLEEVADALAMSERKLQRQLREEGKRFRELQDEVRAERALELLQREQLPAGTVAERLGFESDSAFTRACKRWFGRTPRELRKGEGA